MEYKKFLSSGKPVIFSGAATALITPFSSDGIDFAALGRIVDRQMKEKISALVVCGTTGEAPTLTRDEAKAIASNVKSRVGDKIPVIVGVGCADTAKSVTAARDAFISDADAVMAVTPYYNRPTRDGIIAHFYKIAEASPLPLIVYTVPSRTGTQLTSDTYALLSEHENIVGVKEASGDIKLITEICHTLSGALSIYCGSDELNLPALAVGCEGVISVLSNIMAREVSQLCAAALSDIERACAIDAELMPLARAMFIRSNPIPVKAACSILGLCENELRLPLTPIDKEGYDFIKNLLIH
ncbi:MAG: 4-hydroxy-tetrahydrodipicolinate synthase [Clostridia bacterium]|nr:4-hydroxy-tetrahydrodipicolinate synthase [Clostridia bacterium]